MSIGKFIIILVLAANIVFAEEKKELTITVLFDNMKLNENCTSEWGFACLLETQDEQVLFDTGLKGDVLLHNFKALEIDPGNISKVILSHMHNDHTGGLPVIIKENPNADVYVVDSADNAELEVLKISKNKLHKVKEFTKINDCIYSLGEMPGRANEQSLVIEIKTGIYIITGCAHPGIIKIINKAKIHFKDQPIKLVMGGFHLHLEADETVNQTIEQFKALGVEKAGPTHCTGDHVIQKFADEYGEDFEKLGVGFTKMVEVN